MISKDVVKIIIPGECVPKSRPRLSKSGNVYTPAKTKNYERLVGVYTKRSIKRPIDKGIPLQVGIVITVEPPRSWSKTKREKAINGELSNVTKPDIDNYIKSVLDGMNKIAYSDDNQIVKLFAEKRYGAVSQVEVGIKVLE